MIPVFTPEFVVLIITIFGIVAPAAYMAGDPGTPRKPLRPSPKARPNSVRLT